MVEAEILTELSFQTLFMRADGFVQLILVVLVIMSVWSVAIIVERGLALWWFKQELVHFSTRLHNVRSLETLLGEVTAPRFPSAPALFQAAMEEWDRSHPKNPDFEQVFSRVVGLAAGGTATALEKRLVHLATIGATAPFIGLLGTVWGIMNSFQAIAISGETHLAVVAPGVAEALFATAMGLFAAIPALIFYNKFSSDIVGHVEQFERYAAQLELMIVRREALRNA